MYRKSVILTILFAVLCIELGQGLQCYEHDICVGNGCKNISMRHVTCQSEKSRCWKLQIPKGIKRGCSEAGCKVQLDVGIIETANVCCATDFCNSSNQMQLSIITMLFFGLIVVLHRLYVQ